MAQGTTGNTGTGNRTTGTRNTSHTGMESEEFIDRGDRSNDGTTSSMSKITSEGSRIASDTYSKASELGTEAVRRASECCSGVVQKAEQALSGVGSQISSVASSLKNNTTLNSGAVGSAISTVASTLESSGQYLSQHNVNDIVTDVGAVVRKYPIQSLCIGFGMGILLSGAIRRR